MDWRFLWESVIIIRIVWCVSVNKMKDLLNLSRLIEPYLRHSKRRKDLKTAENNILLRIKNESY